MQTSHSIFLCWIKQNIFFLEKKNTSEVKSVIERMLWLRMCESVSECVQEAKSQKALTWELKGMHHTFLHLIRPFC